MEGRRLASIFVWKNYQKSIYQVCVKERSRTERSSKDDAASLFSCQYLSCLVLSLSLVFFLSLRVSQERTPLPLLLPQLLLYWRHSLYWLRRANGMKLSADPQEADSWINSIIKQTLCSTTICHPHVATSGRLAISGTSRRRRRQSVRRQRKWQPRQQLCPKENAKKHRTSRSSAMTAAAYHSKFVQSVRWCVQSARHKCESKYYFIVMLLCPFLHRSFYHIGLQGRGAKANGRWGKTEGDVSSKWIPPLPLVVRQAVTAAAEVVAYLTTLISLLFSTPKFELTITGDQHRWAKNAYRR